MKFLLPLLLCLFLWFCIGQATANTYQVDARTAKLAFSGEHAGMPFRGVFENWRANIILAPVESATIEAAFALSSAKTGDSTYDETLPEEDWFFVEKFPVANFKSISITKQDADYLVKGELALRGKSLPIEFVLRDSANALTAKFQIDRMAYAIGLDSDPEAEWVSRFIKLELYIKK